MSDIRELQELIESLTPEEIENLFDDWDPVAVPVNADNFPHNPQPNNVAAAQPSNNVAAVQQPNNVAGAQSDSEEYYRVLQVQNRTVKKFNATAKRIIIQLIENDSNPIEFIENAFKKLIEEFVNNDDTGANKVGLTINNSENSENNRPIFISYRPLSELTAEIILNEFQKVIQSNANFLSDEPLQINITKIIVPHGRGKSTHLDMLPYDEFCASKKRSIHVIRNNDNLCLPRALVLGKAYFDKNWAKENLPKKEDKEYALRYKEAKKYALRYKALSRLDRSDKLGDAARDLCEDAGVVIGSDGGGPAELKKFQDYLSDYKIDVYNGSDHSGKTLVFESEVQAAKHINLIYGQNHYNVILTLAGAFAKNEFCAGCHEGFEHKIEHNKCKKACHRCKKEDECKKNPNIGRIQCPKCLRIFNGQQCLKNHTLPHYEKGRSVCAVFKYCDICQYQYSTEKLKGKPHKCEYIHCNNCETYVLHGHLCHVQTLSKKDTNRPKNAYVFFDFESRIDDEKHIPNYCVIQVQCFKCVDDMDVSQKCAFCGEREFVIKRHEGDHLLLDFFRVIQDLLKKKFTKILVFAHNGGGYDFQFIADFMLRMSWQPELILNGSKIMQIAYKKKVVFRDTLNFFQKPLKSLPSMFGLQNIAKGHFPHFFNKPENQNYIGTLPGVEYYGADQMSGKERKNFLKWYNEQLKEKKTFDFQKEMEFYCRADVEILRRASLIFRKLFVDLLHVDPLAVACTIASACMVAYRTNFLPKDTIPLMQFKSYRMREKQSELAVNYIKYFEEKFDVRLQSAYRGTEKKIANYHIDGYCENFPAEKLGSKYGTGNRPLLLEIHGCFYHGCPTCFKNRTAPIYSGSRTSDKVDMDMRFQNTQTKMSFLRNLPCRPIVLEKWECEIYRDCTTDTQLKRCMTDRSTITPIYTNREAFFGGRTENFYR
ncbi:uncharacterized protein LOC135836366 [Planococcus citri]|uniref:uncharacterized protein LOC135836366 n=1 Tax=Planococcus citri TaxID=170843 RepID=UPI0031F7CBFB